MVETSLYYTIFTNSAHTGGKQKPDTTDPYTRCPCPAISFSDPDYFHHVICYLSESTSESWLYPPFPFLEHLFHNQGTGNLRKSVKDTKSYPH